MGNKKPPNPNFHRKNGLSWPLDILQVITWVISALPCFSFFAIQFPFLPIRDTWFWAGIFLVCYVIGILLFVRATLEEHPLPPLTSPDHIYKCRFCRTGVPSVAKHCRLCNKCRVGFDHHCRFINNCVTTANYTVFFFGCLFLVSSALVGLAHLIRTIPITINGMKDILSRMEKHYKRACSTEAFWGLFGVACAIDLGVAIPMLVLTIYHIFFQSKNISTYDYLIDNYSKAPQKLQSFSCVHKNAQITGFN